MISGVTRRMWPHLPGVPHLHVNRPYGMAIFYIHQLHELSLPRPLLLYANRNILERVLFLLLWPWFTTGIFLFIMQSSFVLLNASRQDLCHMTQLANVKGIPFSTSKHFGQLPNVIISSQKMLGIQHQSDAFSS